MTLTEATEALSRGVIDAVAYHPAIAAQTGAAEIATNHYMVAMGTGHVYLTMRQEDFDALPEAAKSAIDSNSGLSLSRAWGAEQDRQAAELMEAWSAEDSGHVITEPSAADREAIANKFEAIRQEWSGGDPHRAEILKAIEEELASLD